MTELLIERVTACPCCGSGRHSPVPHPRVNIGHAHFSSVASHLGLCRCHACEVAFVNPRPSRALLDAFYNRDDYDCHDPAYEMDIAESGDTARLDLLEQVAKRGTLLDFGAGAGHLLRLAQRRGWEHITGVELGESAREALVQEGFAVYPDIAKWRLMHQTADAVTMVHVLEHLTEPGAVLDLVADLLDESGGAFYVEVPNADSLRARIALSPLRRFWTAPVERYCAFPIHLQYFNPRALRRLLEDHHLKIVSMGTIGLGVDELFARPCARRPARQGGVADGALSRPFAHHKTPKRFAAVRSMVKRLMSALRLGENLFAVCTPARDVGGAAQGPVRRRS